MDKKRRGIRLDIRCAVKMGGAYMTLQEGVFLKPVSGGQMNEQLTQRPARRGGMKVRVVNKRVIGRKRERKERI